MARLRVVALDIAASLLGLLMVWTAIWFALSHQRGDLRREALNDASNLARGFEENIVRTLDSIDKTLLFARASYLRDPTHFGLSAIREDLAASPDTLTFQLAIIGPDGRLLQTTIPNGELGIDLSDRDHFRIPRDTADDRMYISTPLLGRASNKWSIQFSRRMTAADGSFAGVVVVSLDPFVLSAFYASLDIGQGVILLAGTDGIVRARAPTLEGFIGVPAFPDKLLWQDPSRSAATIEDASLNGAQREIVSYRRLARYPLVVAVGLPTQQIYAPFRENLLTFIAGGTGVSALIIALGVLLVRSKLGLLRSREVLLRSRETLAAAVDNINQGIIMVDADDRIKLLSRRAIALLNLPQHLTRPDAPFSELLRWQVDNGEFGSSDSVFVGLAEQGGVTEVSPIYERTRPNGVVLEVRTQHLPDGGIVRTFADITERKQSEERIRHLAHHDALTALANRRMFNEQLADAIARAELNDACGFAVLCLDLDRFKTVNDLRGHSVGDRLLIQVADRIRSAIRGSDWAARFGGDEFAILQTQADQPRAAAALARRLIDILSEGYDIDGQMVQVGVSVGVALCPLHGTSADRLLQHADTALYSAKAGGRGAYRLFEPSMDAAVQERRRMEQDIRRAVADNQLSLNYQPIRSVATGEPISFEALLRWRHPTRGNIPPSDFIPAAEESGMIIPLGRWVLRAACTDASLWPIAARLSVNLSPTQFRDPDLPIEVAATLRQTGFPAEMLTLEVTEGVLIEDSDRALATMQELKRLGLRIALDDFGTGHASLSYLRRFPFDSIKVDRSFVQCLETDQSACAIVRSIITLGRNLGLDVVAEGVETIAQLQMLRDFGYEQVQGFYLGKPMTRRELEVTFGSRVPVPAGT